MFRTSLAALVALAFASSGVMAQSLTDAQILEAIKAGESKKFDHLISDCIATAGFGEIMRSGDGVTRTGSFNVVLSTNPGRIAFMAARAKRLYKRLRLDDVTADLRTPAVVVSVEPIEPQSSGKTISVAAPIEHMVLKSKTNQDQVAQPSHVDKEPVEWSNLLGGKVEANRAVAFFEFGSSKGTTCRRVRHRCRDHRRRATVQGWHEGSREAFRSQVMRRTITVDGAKWTVTTTGMSHDINGVDHSTGLRFEADDGTEVFGRYRIEPEKIDSVTDDQLAEALRAAIDPSLDD